MFSETEDNFSKAFYIAPIAMIISTIEEGVLLEVNEAFERLSGYTADKVIGRTTIELGIWNDPQERRDMVALLEREKTVCDKELLLRDKEGEFRSFIFSGVVFDLHGKKRLLSLVNDITARKRAEQEIETLNTHLASHVTELEAANRELEAFNYTVSHDLRSPLTRICGYSDLLLNLSDERLGEQALGNVREINKAAVEMSKLIETLLGFSHMSRCEIKREEIDLTAIAREVAAQLRMVDPSRQVRFVFAEGVKADGDVNLLSVVMENLLGNAWKYTARQESTLIEFGFDETNARPAYFVRDNSPGFDLAHADRLFRPFQRLPETTDFATGHGIGLATVQRIVERHGGSAWACGEPGRGATFYFTL